VYQRRVQQGTKEGFFFFFFFVWMLNPVNLF
jgi:hypothetical protein